MRHEDPGNNPEIINFFDFEPLNFNRSCLTIGNFDGVHLGHQAVIKRILKDAKPHNDPVIVVTFFPNPSDYFNKNLIHFYLSTPQEKEDLLLDLGVDKVVTFRFDEDLANLSPRTFLKGLKEKLDLNLLVIGRDFALGKNRVGTLPVIQRIGKSLGFDVRIIPPVNFQNQEISSTEIRRRLDQGDVLCAAKMLGRPYAISGPVSHGSDRGARIGLPTANISHWPYKKLPAVGVYATGVILEGQFYQGITNVGFRPTFETQTTPNVETHILDFDRLIYGETLELQFIKKIRDEKKFDGVDAFLAQISRDKAKARKIFGNETS